MIGGVKIFVGQEGGGSGYRPLQKTCSSFFRTRLHPQRVLYASLAAVPWIVIQDGSALPGTIWLYSAKECTLYKSCPNFAYTIHSAAAARATPAVSLYCTKLAARAISNIAPDQ